MSVHVGRVVSTSYKRVVTREKHFDARGASANNRENNA